MLIDGIILKDGMDMVGYLDEKMAKAANNKRTVTGIIISTAAREELSKACRNIMGVKAGVEETINKFRGALLIEDADNENRLEVIMGTVAPVETGDPFALKRVPGRGRR